MRLTTRTARLSASALAPLVYAWVALSTARLAHAQPAPVDAPTTSKGTTATLGWARLDGAEDCIGTQELAQAVDKLLGRSVFVSPSAAELAVEGRVEKKADGSGFRAVLSVANVSGESLGTRELETEGACSGLNESVALAIALMVDPDAELGKSTAPPKPPVEAPKPPETKIVYVPARNPPVVPMPAPPERPVWRGDVSVGFALGFGWLPDVNPGVFGAASLTPPKFIPIEGSITFFAPTTEDAVAGATVMFYSLQGAGFLCPLEYRGEILGGRACAGVTGGFIVADAEGFDVEDSDDTGIYGTVGATLRGRGSVRLHSLFHLGIAAEMTVPFIRPDFVYAQPDGSSTRVFRPPPVMGTLHAFAMVAFP